MEKDISSVPKLSSDLDVQKFSKTEYLLHQRKYAHYIKVSKQVFQLIELIDGQRDFETVSKVYNAKYPEDITPEFIHNLFFEKLSKYGILENTHHLAKVAEKPDYLKLSFIIINDRLLSKITPLFGFLFHPKLIRPLFATSFVICVLTLWINFVGIKDFFYMFIPDLKSLITFFGIMFVSVTFHEIGHASAARFYGAKHGGIGGGFYLFTPVYYADVTDIWRLRSAQRIIVNLAGVYFEFLFCSFLCVISLLLGNPYLGVMAFIVFLHSLYNLVPFIRSDGYWVLSDALSIPNLAKNASNRLIGWFKNIYTLRKYKYSPKVIFLLVYGFVNNSFMVIYVCSVLIYDADSVLYFPLNLYNYMSDILFVANGSFVFSDLKQFIIPIVFYYLTFRFLKGFFKNNFDKIREGVIRVFRRKLNIPNTLDQ